MGGFSRRTLLAMAAGVLVLAGCAAPSATPAPAQSPLGSVAGGLVAHASTVDLGRVPFDRQVEARFDLVNTADRAVKLTAQPQVKMLEGC